MPAPSPPTPPERKGPPSAQPVTTVPSADSSGAITRNLYRTLRPSFRPFTTGKKLSHTRSTPDLSSLLADNVVDEDTSSSSLENLSKTYTMNPIPQQRPPGSILKRPTQTKPGAASAATIPTKSVPMKALEEPIFVSSVSVPFQQSPSRDQNTHRTERYRFRSVCSRMVWCAATDLSLFLRY